MNNSVLPKKVKVNVTQDHIDNGIDHICILCPIALAIKDLFPNNIVTVSNAVQIDFCKYALPLKALRFINQFDRGESVKPFSFKIKKFE